MFPLHVLVVKFTEVPRHCERAVNSLELNHDVVVCLLNPLGLQVIGRLVVNGAEGGLVHFLCFEGLILVLSSESEK